VTVTVRGADSSPRTDVRHVIPAGRRPTPSLPSRNTGQSREFGDDPCRYASAKARRNDAGTSPITRASGKRKIVAARFVRNDRLTGALMIQAFAALRTSPGARAFYDAQRAKGLEHNDALRRLASRLVGILHGCLKTGTCYDEAIAWGHRENTPQSEAAA
jgi:hypothetical protein